VTVRAFATFTAVLTWPVVVAAVPRQFTPPPRLIAAREVTVELTWAAGGRPAPILTTIAVSRCTAHPAIITISVRTVLAGTLATVTRGIRSRRSRIVPRTLAVGPIPSLPLSFPRLS
jgi:hypothetical protein